MCRSRCRSCPSARHALVRPLNSPQQSEILADTPFSAFAFYFLIQKNPAHPQLQQLVRVLPSSSSHCPTMAELASCTIYIKGIATTATEADIRDACSQYGNITEVAIPEGKDFCFVEFAEEAQAQVGRKTTQNGRQALLRCWIRGSDGPPASRRVGIAIRVLLRCPHARHVDRSLVNIETWRYGFFGRLFLMRLRRPPRDRVFLAPPRVSFARARRAGLSITAACFAVLTASCLLLTPALSLFFSFWEEFLFSFRNLLTDFCCLSSLLVFGWRTTAAQFLFSAIPRRPLRPAASMCAARTPRWR